jgi:hypothetical protein
VAADGAGTGRGRLAGEGAVVPQLSDGGDS